MMFYAAILLIGIGLFLLLFIFLSPLQNKKEIHLPVREIHNSPEEMRPAPPPPASVQETIQETRVSADPRPRVHSWNSSDLHSLNQKRFQWIEPSEKSTVFEDKIQENTGGYDAGKFSAEGILFIDYARQVHLHAGRFDSITPEILMKLQRMGKADIIIQEGAFTIHSGNRTNRYSSEDLEQIFFLDSGIALVPHELSEPVAIFLTDSVEQMRNFIKKYSRETSRK